MILKLGRSTPDEVAATLKTAHPARTRAVLEMWAAGLAAVEPERAVAQALAGHLPGDEVTIVGLGKAAPAMARGAARLLGGQLKGGLIVTDHVEALPAGVELLLGGHPDPDRSSLEAGRRLLEVVGGATHRLLFLISGGGSALAEVPAPGLSLDDLVTTRRVLQGHGVAIREMNTVRTHLSCIKGGRLVTAANVPFMTVVISDVAGGKPDLVAAGPTIAAPTSPGDARRVLERHRVLQAIPGAVKRVLDEASPPPRPPNGPVIVAADGATAARAAADAGGGQVLTTTLSGRAAQAARWAVSETPPGTIGVLAGETTVEVTGAGSGGRNQEAALAAAMAIEGGEILFMAAGTDGIDGPTDAAGGLVDGGTTGLIEQAGWNPAAALTDNDSYHALEAAGALIRTGPTGTNVADLWIVDRTQREGTSPSGSSR